MAPTSDDGRPVRVRADAAAERRSSDRPAAPDDLVAALKDALDQLGTELDRHRAARDELNSARGALQDLEAREQELLAELEARDRRLADQEALQNELARRWEESERQAARLAELERTVARVASERDDAERRGRDQQDRAEAECVALAREVLDLEERIAALQAEQATGDGDRDRALHAARQALSALQHTHAETVADRDALVSRASTLERRLDEVTTARAQLDAELHDSRERWAVERAQLEAHGRNERDSLRKQANARFAALRQQVQRLNDALTAQKASRQRTAVRLKRIRARWAARIHEVHARWNGERQSLLDGAERALTERVDALQAECHDLRHKLQAAGRAGNALAAAQRDLESLHALLDETRRERDSALQVAEARDGAEGALARLRAELAQLRDAQRTDDAQHEEALRSVREERDRALAALRERIDDAASYERDRTKGSTELDRLRALLRESSAERDALRTQLESQDRERTTLNESLHAAKAALERGRAGAIEEVERLQRLVADVSRERDHARRRLKAYQGRAAPSEAAARAASWLDAVLAQMASAAPGAIQGQQMLAERLRMVRAALAERVGGSIGQTEQPPRPRSEDFRAPGDYRAAIAAWLDQASARRHDVTAEMERLTAEVQSAHDELGLLDRDLALGHWNDEDPDAIAFDGVAALAESRLEQEQ